MYQRASAISLWMSVIVLAIGALAGGAPLPITVFGGAIFDFLIWRRLSDPELSLTSATRVRFLALARTVLGAAFALYLALSGSGGRAWLNLAVLAFVATLYLRSPHLAPAPDASGPPPPEA